MKVLVACEYSQVVTQAFRERGHDAYSCDLLPTLGDEEYHYQCSALEVLNYDWDLMVAHPPCTFLANSGVRWLYNKDKTENTERWENMREGAAFFQALLDAPIPRIAIENPIMHKHARALISKGWRQTIQPWQYGHGYTKRTCLWLKNLPTLEPTDVVEGREPIIHMCPPGPNRGLIRSLTPEGIANAMADQWGKLGDRYE